MRPKNRLSAAAPRRVPVNPTERSLNPSWQRVATRWRSGRTWWTATVLRDAMLASSSRAEASMGSSAPEARVVIETAPGEEAQVDYGTGPMVRDLQTGKYRRTRLFVLTLGCSRKSVRLLVFRSSSRVWAELHEKAFRRLGGVTRVVVLDNLPRRRDHTPTFTMPHSIRSTATAEVLRRGRFAVPRARSGSKRQGSNPASARKAQKNAAEGVAAFRYFLERSANASPGLLGGCWADGARIHAGDQAVLWPRHVCWKMKLALLASAGRAFSARHYSDGERTVRSGLLRRS